jgi:hypothetical protein
MREADQIDALYEEIYKVILRFDGEFDLNVSDKVWVLQCLINDISDVNLDFEADFEDEN